MSFYNGMLLLFLWEQLYFLEYFIALEYDNV